MSHTSNRVTWHTHSRTVGGRRRGKFWNFQIFLKFLSCLPPFKRFRTRTLSGPLDPETEDAGRQMFRDDTSELLCWRASMQMRFHFFPSLKLRSQCPHPAKVSRASLAWSWFFFKKKIPWIIFKDFWNFFEKSSTFTAKETVCWWIISEPAQWMRFNSATLFPCRCPKTFE